MVPLPRVAPTLLLAVALVLAIAAPASAQDQVVFDGDFSPGLRDYAAVVHPERITVRRDPHGLPRRAARFAVRDSDVGPTSNPRALVSSREQLHAGREVWIGWSTLFPRRFPRSIPGWLTFASTYGPPYRGTGPIKFGVEGTSIVWRRNATYGWDVPWRMPLVRGRWVDFVVHQRLSRSRRRGFVELWINSGGGWQRQGLNGRARLRMRTLDRSNARGPNVHSLSNYRKRGMFASVSLYHASHRLGTSFAAVAPRSHG